jgi:separase
MGIHDPSGPSLSYLLGGASWVIGNLWDVTDKDIDKLSIDCMKNTFIEAFDDNTRNENGGIGSNLSSARSVCKLKKLVGFSPVIYGVPISIDPLK